MVLGRGGGGAERWKKRKGEGEGGRRREKKRKGGRIKRVGGGRWRRGGKGEWKRVERGEENGGKSIINEDGESCEERMGRREEGKKAYKVVFWNVAGLTH